jgi:succinoglycan biosynthesis transport protein ExoP
MELKRYLLPLLRWWWLLAAAMLIAALASFIATLRQPQLYQSLTTLMIGQVIADPNPTSTEFNLSQQLAENYAEIANREPVRLATKQALGLEFLPEYRASALPNGQFIEIMVTDTDPDRARLVANELANQMVLRSPTGDQTEEQERQAFVQTQLDNLQVQITDTEAEIQTLREALGEMDSARQIADTQAQINALGTKLSDLQGIYSDLLANTQSGAINTITVIEEASVRPLSSNKALIILLSAGIGLSLAVSAAYLLDYLDDTLKSTDEVTELTNAPILGYLSELDSENVGALYAAENPRHPNVEEIRNLRTNLEFAEVDKPLKAIFISSTDMEEGKTSVAANLAVIMAQAEKKVIVIDADMRRPNLHNYFGFANNLGLSEVFRDKLEIEDVIKEWEGGGVSVVTAGEPPPNPAELLGSRKMAGILENLKQQTDTIIIDGPPFVVADAPILASKADGVLLIFRIGHTRKPAVKAMMEQINRSGAKVVGVALNRLPSQQMGYYTNHRYYASYYETDDFQEYGRTNQGGFRSRLASMFPRLFQRADSSSSSNRVFDDIDSIEGEGDSYRWNE